ncbi:putative DsbA family dithiol-disulfide isomerase [Luteibacter jiangsuensis]|uniref:DsbA family dithiol-disulfide isomerase n=1 Tax=Luteibacter jiangsuensis TaxID=637577 RepID=A0ABT9ST74_9GAMM|nr:DsbA family oxidoreductase [Luteibacter jiangsuensis]MDQ0008190.1 putative DsbA family dithiol-disulfide isomerase [Luteibacter jiangsuensis]
MPQKMKIDFVSDIACPWCAIGLGGLERALERLHDVIEPEIVFHPFELNPGMQPGGENTVEHVVAKYRIPADEARQNRERIKARAAAVGFTMNTSDASRIYNTFDAHRLIAWAAKDGKQRELTRQLFGVYFTDQTDPGDHDALVMEAERVGLDPVEARAVLESDRHADEVRRDEALWQSRGITGVPAVIVNDQYLISGGQPPEEFERQLRGIANATA